MTSGSNSEGVIGDVPRKRIVAALLLVAVLGMFLVIAGWHVNKGTLMTAVVADYEAHQGESMSITGVIVATNPPELLVSTDHGDVEFKLTGIDSKLSEGDRVRVYGTLRENYTLEVREAVVHQSRNMIYMYGVSVGGAALAVAVVHSRLRLDHKRIAFVLRRDR